MEICSTELIWQLEEFCVENHQNNTWKKDKNGYLQSYDRLDKP
jgi:hypothetical protein